jgi:alpha/beta superfamily hydrolase
LGFEARAKDGENAMSHGGRTIRVRAAMELFIPGPAGRLEAAFWTARDGKKPRAAAVMCHPHPLYGGTMSSSVVFRAARGLELAGVQVLRFNFRGVGRSEGVHDGKGGEGEDLRAALDWLEERSQGLELWAGGFSFGSRTAALLAAEDQRIARVVLVAFPVAAFDCSFIREVRKPGLILMAENDEYGTRSQLLARYPDLHPDLEVVEIPGAGHFFEGATQAVQERVREWAERTLER